MKAAGMLPAFSEKANHELMLNLKAVICFHVHVFFFLIPEMKKIYPLQLAFLMS